MEDWDDDEFVSTGSGRFDRPTSASVWLGFIVVFISFCLLPESCFTWSEALWRTHQRLRREMLQLLRLSARGPVFKLLAGCLQPVLTLLAGCVRACSCGRLSSRCRPPHSLCAKASGPTEVMLIWTPLRLPNAFHDERYVIAWRPHSDSGEPLDLPWTEQLIDSNLYGTAQDGRWGTLVDGLPEAACLRVRLCSVNRLGRSKWSHEEVEVITLALLQEDGRPVQRPACARTRMVSAPGIQLCLQCSTPLSAKKCSRTHAKVACRPIFGPDCPHGPFCERCRNRVSEQALPCCVCRGLVDTWVEPAKPLQPAATSSVAALNSS
ncbi:unnamed protein product [Polarella glacialis]|uniref:Fibronectin type-III domain-containing protein n=1 Tax=Polarella glacialis TaxID=89957 RepID=A0A813EID4_POLGL|nr:unnamed protein product [Polarella glacialis]